MNRRGNTGKEIVESGEFCKVGRQGGKPIYQHIDGAIISYDCMAWGWRINKGVECYTALHAAVTMFRQQVGA